MKIGNTSFLIAAAIGFLTGCKHSETNNAITGDEIKSHIAVLADDSLLGRKPFTIGETKAINYISSQFKKLGLEPGNNGSYFQEVPMVEITSTPSAIMQISGDKTNISLSALTDFVASTRREVDTVTLKNSPLVFAGYGIVAPEYHWNDYAGLDVKGKTVVVLVNDPGFKSGDRTLFKGDTMTYYGRWTYKYEEAARQGAAGIIIVHQTEPASYGWSVVTNSFTGAKLYLQQKDKHLSRCKVEGWITEDAAKKLLSAAGITGDIRAIARKRDFKAIPLNLNATLTVQTKLKYSTSHNVVAVLKGSTSPDECILYTAHWDHLGVGKPDAKGDSIYNGAVDNASGVAAVLSVAKAFTQLKDKPKRTIVFLAVTAEEQGLLGSEYYATHPIFPLNKTVADLNMDALGDYGETNDFAITGKGQNDLDDYVKTYTDEHGKKVTGDKNPGAGSYYRSDHFNFAKVGVPALDLNNGAESTAHGEAWGKQKQNEYNNLHYHQPSDNYTPAMNADGMAQVANLLFAVGDKLANETTFPGWKNGSEFKAVREKSIGK
ncbi:Zn-dependent M28 family amino/carboxypeptidase [Mucilaginibacter frigoritolerans]|uniref:Zn-dependent M28 family amino/carboxypeptidase n=1 Tax=Mucilaginibacter frigoritolerans TaxID=652788 RepID=A0A562U2L5_9SPHI|nr:M28 family metallopeptidase [Mucilaginibacter frigoritolerans]TWI99973.1 Zn-dependent M28 family amino/carboxypeptidase [Mucilaginibacter frigoritolerans]